MSRPHLDWRNVRVGQLTILRLKRTQARRPDPRWTCFCDCGAVCDIPFSRLERGIPHCGDVAQHPIDSKGKTKNYPNG